MNYADCLSVLRKSALRDLPLDTEPLTGVLYVLVGRNHECHRAHAISLVSLIKWIVNRADKCARSNVTEA
jgi:hypothetical protein